MPLTPYTGPFDRPELKHLLGRTLFGCSNADLQHFEGGSLDQLVNELLTFSGEASVPIKTYFGLNGNTPDPSLIDPDVAFGETWIDTVRQADNQQDLTQLTSNRIQSYMWWRTGLVVEQDRNLREKLVLFWYNHMPTQAFEIFNPRLSYEYDQLLRDNCKGNFRQLMYEVSTSGAMLLYLNGFLNTAAAPDENFARELMELFTLEEGTGYTEEDVQTAARVLTGWTVREQDQQGDPVLPFVLFRPNQHDALDKQFSGFFNNTLIAGQSDLNAGATELNALLDMIFLKEEVSLLICRELCRFFVHGEIDETTESNVIVPLAEIFRNNATAPDQMRIVLHALFTSEYFFSTQVRACMIMSPADLVIGSIRKFEMPLPDTSQIEAQYRIWRDIYGLCSYSGQDLMDPPNVAGWPAYHQFPIYDNIWLDSATYPARKNAVRSILVNGFATANNVYQASSANLSFKVDLVALVSGFTDPMDPNALVADAAELMMAVPISITVRDQLKTNYLLFGQQNDVYWSDAYELYIADPTTTNMTAQLVPSILLWLLIDITGAAETQLH
ncbi:MAG: DUF1800 domain-containing protein [Bacteroidota bacterium]|nr:DUF1800 domain-containing protein [Bacteroidota bacterium]